MALGQATIGGQHLRPATQALKQKQSAHQLRHHKELPKQKVTISTANILKKKLSKAIHESPRRFLPKSKVPIDNELVQKHREAIETSRATLMSDAQRALDETHTELCETHGAMQKEKDSCLLNLKILTERLLSPLAEDQIQSQLVVKGKETTRIAAIGERFDDFHAAMIEHLAELKSLWEKHREVEDEILQLGVQVFGIDGFEENNELFKFKVETGFKEDMETMRNEKNVFRVDVETEMEALGESAHRMMKSAEKANDDQLKKGQQELLLSMFGFQG